MPEAEFIVITMNHVFHENKNIRHISRAVLAFFVFVISVSIDILPFENML